MLKSADDNASGLRVVLVTRQPEAEYTAVGQSIARVLEELLRVKVGGSVFRGKKEISDDSVKLPGELRQDDSTISKKNLRARV